MLKDIGLHALVTLYSDSSAARGIIQRAGLGKLCHLETGYLWLQAAVAKKRLQVRKENGPENPADLFTKYLTNADMWKHVNFLQISSEDGRSHVVPRTKSIPVQVCPLEGRPVLLSVGASGVFLSRSS